MIEIEVDTYLDLAIESLGLGAVEIQRMPAKLALEVAEVFVGPPGADGNPGPPGSSEMLWTSTNW